MNKKIYGAIFFMFLLIAMNLNLNADEQHIYEINTTSVASATTQNADQNSRTDYSTYENNLKVSSNAGELQYVTAQSFCVEEYEIAHFSDGKLYFDSCSESFESAKRIATTSRNSDNNIILSNGQIVFAEQAIAMTTGGYSTINMIYPTPEDALNQTNGVTVSGGGFDAAYYNSVSEENEIFYEIQISGYHGYISSNEATIIPQEIIKSQSHYMNENGELVYYSAIDPMSFNSYEKIILGPAPEKMTENVEYFSYDDVNYYNNNLTDTTGSTAVLEDYTYWQWLPMRSASNATATEYKNFLESVGHSDSEYYNYTQGFIDAENKFGINQTLLFSMANLESAYGTSKYARNCHNFFGYGAIDSNPDNACSVEEGGVYFPSDNQIDDAIIAQASHLAYEYQDVTDWRYFGSHVGNKTTGMNVKYASDPDWGKKIAGIAYNFDEFAQNYETGYYKLGVTTTYTEVYKYDTGNSIYTVTNAQGNSKEYHFERGGTDGSNMYTEMPVIITDDDTNRYKITLPTPAKQTSNEVCQWGSNNSGYYPAYSGQVPINVSVGTANYSCNYNWNDDYGYVDKADVRIINDVPDKDIGTAYNIVTVDPYVATTIGTNTPLKYNSSLISAANTPLVVTAKVYDSKNNLIGYQIISNPVTAERDFVKASDIQTYTGDEYFIVDVPKNEKIFVNQNSNTTTEFYTIKNDTMLISKEPYYANSPESDGSYQWNRVLRSIFNNSWNYLPGGSISGVYDNIEKENMYLKIQGTNLIIDGELAIHNVVSTTTNSSKVEVILTSKSTGESTSYNTQPTSNGTIYNKINWTLDLKTIAIDDYECKIRIYGDVNGDKIIDQSSEYYTLNFDFVPGYISSNNVFTLEQNSNVVELNRFMIQNIESIKWDSQGKLVINGSSKHKDHPISEPDDVAYRLILKNKTTGEEFYYTKSSGSYNQSSNDYSMYTYTISLKGLPIGTYDVKIRTYVDTNNDGKVDINSDNYYTTNLYTTNSKLDSQNTIQILNHKYKMYITNDILKIDVTSSSIDPKIDVNEISWTKDGKLKINGDAFISGYPTFDKNDVAFKLILEDTITGEEYYYSQWTGLDSTGADPYNDGIAYNHNGFSFVVDPSILATGEYKVSLRTYIDTNNDGQVTFEDDDYYTRTLKPSSNTIFNLEDIVLINDKKYSFKLKNGEVYLFVEQATTTKYQLLNNISWNGNNLSISGAAGVSGYKQNDTNDIAFKLVFKNQQNGQEYFFSQPQGLPFDMTEIINDGLSHMYNGFSYNLPISSIPVGNYTLSIRVFVDTNKSGTVSFNGEDGYFTIPLTATNTQISNVPQKNINGTTYRFYLNPNNQIMLSAT